MEYTLPMAVHHRDDGRVEHLWILALAIAAIVGSLILEPRDNTGLGFPIPGTHTKVVLPDTCVSRLVFRVPCPGCGLTRSFAALGRGDLVGALAFNPMGPCLYVLCWLQIPYRICQYAGVGQSNRRWQWISERLHFVTWAVVAGLIATWVARLLFR